MDINNLISGLAGHITPFNVAIVVALIASEVLGSVESIKASSIFGLVKALLLTLKDQTMPQPQSTTLPPTQP